MPAPPNIRLTVTVPNGSNSSFRPSTSTLVASGWRVKRLGARRGNCDAFAAAAGRGLVGIGESEGGGQAVDLEIHLRAEQEQHRLRIDQQLDPLVLDHFIRGGGRLGQ